MNLDIFFLISARYIENKTDHVILMPNTFRSVDKPLKKME